MQRPQKRPFTPAIALFLFIAITFLAAGAAAVSSAASDRAAVQVVGTAVLITDGSFEQEPSRWRERDNTSCTPWIGEWSMLPGLPAAFHGSRYFWAGGACGPAGAQEENSNSARQFINLQPIDTTLSFWYYALRVNADSAVQDDYAYLKINNTEIWRLDMVQANNTDGWVNATVDVTSYAGQKVLLELGAVNGSEPGHGSVFFDYVEIIQSEAPLPDVTISKSPDSQTIAQGKAAFFTIEVINSGNVTLYDIVVDDAATPACAQGIGDLVAGASVTYDCLLSNVTDSFTNVAAVSGVDFFGTPVNDTDAADVLVIDSQIDISITPQSQTAVNGSANFSILVTNPGNAELKNVIVTSNVAADCNRTIGRLPAGGDSSYSCTLSGIQQSLLHQVTVTARDPLDAVLSASDNAFVDVVNGSVAVVVLPKTQNVAKNDAASFTIFVFNIGDIPLSDVSITSVQAPDCNRALGALAVDSEAVIVCRSNAVIAPFVNSVTATATIVETGATIQDTDVAAVEMLDLAVELTAVNDEITAPGGPITFAMTVTNTGSQPVSLTEIAAVVSGSDLVPISTPLENSTCALNVTLSANGGAHTCHFALTFSGAAGSYQVGVSVTATSSDDIFVRADDQSIIVLNKPPITNVYLPLITHKYVLGEPNNTCGEAYPISPNRDYQFLADDVNDWYRFSLDKPAAVTIKLNNFLPISGQMTAWTGTCNGLTFLGQNGDFTTSKQIDLGQQAAGTYYVWLINDGPTTITTPYTIHISAP